MLRQIQRSQNRSHPQKHHSQNALNRRNIFKIQHAMAPSLDMAQDKRNDGAKTTKKTAIDCQFAAK